MRVLGRGAADEAKLRRINDKKLGEVAAVAKALDDQARGVNVLRRICFPTRWERFVFRVKDKVRVRRRRQR